MGSCGSHEEFEINSSTVIRAFEEDGNKPIVNFFDILHKESRTIQFKIFPYKSIGKLSFINIEHDLYFIGEQENKKSTLIKMDLQSKIGQFSILSCSNYCHNKPTLCYFKRNYIVALGGLHNKAAEYYNLNDNAWVKLPDINEERHGCRILGDDIDDNLYLFGGYSSIHKKDLSSVLKLSFKAPKEWKILSVKNQNLLEKSNFYIVRTQKDFVLIIGGSKGNQDCSDTIVQFDLSSNIALGLSHKTFFPCRFDVFSHAEQDGKMYIIDDANQIHMINKRENYCDIFYSYTKNETKHDDDNKISS